MSPLSRRELLQRGAAGGLALSGVGALAGCTVSREVDKAGANRVVTPKVDGDLLIYNWAQYMDPALKKEFSEKYGVEVNEVNFDNLEAMVVKLRSGAEYDLIWPSTEYVARLAAEGLLLKFDRDKLKNSDNISPFYDTPWWDKNNEYGIPYTYYTTGIAWRDDEVSGMTGSWNDLSNPDGEGRMFILDDFQEAIGEANLINGFDLNTQSAGGAGDLEGDAACPEGERPRLLHQLRAEPRLGDRRDPPGVERRPRERPQPGRRPRELQVRDVRGGRARRHRPDEHPGHRAQPGHGDAVHGLDHLAGGLGQERRCGTATRSRSRAASRSSRSSRRRSRRSTSTWRRWRPARSSTASTTRPRASSGPTPSPR